MTEKSKQINWIDGGMNHSCNILRQNMS